MREGLPNDGGECRSNYGERKCRLVDFEKGPPQNAIPVRIELYPKRPNVMLLADARRMKAMAAPIRPAMNIIRAAFLEASITPTSTSRLVSGELISGTSEIPFRSA